MPSYITILGRQPELGLVELESVLGADAVKPFGHQALLSSQPTLDRLGGSIKVAQVLTRQPWTSLDDIAINLDQLPRPSHKLTFGVSYYGPKLAPRSVERWALGLKSQLKSQGPVRYLAPRLGHSDLTAAQLKFNGLPDAGFELIITRSGQEVITALTQQIQDIDAYAQRDYGRPSRSGKVGMLPPKLAQILINTTHGQAVHDPFCGTGVILQEALLAGRPASGGDLSPDMVAATRQNLEWLASQTPDLPSWEVNLADARLTTLPPGVAVVSEGYLGPNLSSLPTAADVTGIQVILQPLYLESMTNFAQQLPSGSEVSICLPAWRTQSGWKYLEIVDEIAALGYTIKRFTTAPQQRLLYARDDTIVGRQILLLTKV